MNPATRTAFAALLIALALPAQRPDPEIPTHRQSTGNADREIQTRDLLGLAAHIHATRRATSHEPVEDTDSTFEPDAIAREILAGVRAYVEPPFADGEDVQLVAGRYLVAVSRAAQHRWIDRFLHSQPRTAAALVEIELHLFRAGVTALEKAAVGGHARALDAQAGAGLAATLERDRIARGSERLALTLSAYPLARLSLSRTNQTSYVRDFEAVGAGDGAVVADPLVDVVRDGMTLTGTTFHLEGGRIGVRGDICFSDLLRPLPTKSIAVAANAAPVEIQIPALREFRIPVDIVLEDGGYAALPGPIFEGRRLIAVLRARSQR